MFCYCLCLNIFYYNFEILSKYSNYKYLIRNNKFFNTELNVLKKFNDICFLLQIIWEAFTRNNYKIESNANMKYTLPFGSFVYQTFAHFHSAHSCHCQQNALRRVFGPLYPKYPLKLQFAHTNHYRLPSTIARGNLITVLMSST